MITDPMHFHPFQRSPFASGFTPEIVPRWKLSCFLSILTVFNGRSHHTISLWVLSFQRRASSNKLKTRVFGNPGKVPSHFRVSRWDPKTQKPQILDLIFVGRVLGVPLEKPVRGEQNSWKTHQVEYRSSSDIYKRGQQKITFSKRDSTPPHTNHAKSEDVTSKSLNTFRAT